MDEFVSELRARGLLAPDAADRVEALESRARLPLAREIHSLLYLGAALTLGGVGAAVKDRLDALRPATILAALGLAAGGGFAYCFRFGRPFAPGRVESPAAAFDYVLYLACGLTGVFVSYLEWKWKLLGSGWDLYLFASGLLFAALAYRFDNRLVLATGLLNLAAAFGLRAGRWDMGLTAKPVLLAYGAALVALGFGARRGRLKPHFEDAYLSLGVHLAFMTLLTDATSFSMPQYWMLLLAGAALGSWSMGERRFDTFAAAVGYVYIGTLISLLRLLGRDFSVTLWTVVLSSGAAAALLLWARARFKEKLA